MEGDTADQILLSSCSSSEVVIEGLRPNTGRRYIDEALTTKREGGYFSRRAFAALVVLLEFIFIFSPDIISQLVSKN